MSLAWTDSTVQISGEDLYSKIDKTARVPSGGWIDTAEARYFLDSILLDTLTGLAASSVNIRDYYVEYFTLRLRYQDFIAKAFINEYIRYKIDIDSSEVIEFYNAFPERFQVEPQVELLHILIAPHRLLDGPDSTAMRQLDSASFESAVKDYTYALFDKISDRSSFEEIAFSFSHDIMSARVYGYVGWTVLGQYFDPFDSIVTSQEPPALFEPYRDKDAWHIVYVADAIKEGPVSLDREGVFDGVHDALMKERVDAKAKMVIDSLFRSAEITLNESLLDTNTYQVDDTAWIGIINDVDTVDYRYLKNYEEKYRRRYKVDNTTPEMKKEIVSNIALRFIFVQAAEDLGYTSLPYIKAERENLQFLAGKSILEARRWDAAWKPSDSAVRLEYDENFDKYNPALPWEVDLIGVSDSALGEYFRDLAESGYDFDQLVKDHMPEGIESTAKYEVVGKTGPDSPDSAIIRAAKITTQGSVSHPIRTDNGFVLVHFIKKTLPQQFGQARGNIISKLVHRFRQAKNQAALFELMDRFGATKVKKLPAMHYRTTIERRKK